MQNPARVAGFLFWGSKVRRTGEPSEVSKDNGPTGCLIWGLATLTCDYSFCISPRKLGIPMTTFVRPAARATVMWHALMLIAGLSAGLSACGNKDAFPDFT